MSDLLPFLSASRAAKTALSISAAAIRLTDPAAVLPPSQQRRADVEAIAHSVLAGKARAHAVALVVVKLALEQGAAIGSLYLPAAGFGCEKLLNAVKGRAIDNGVVFALEPLAAVVHLAEVDSVFEEVGEGTIGEGNATIVFGDPGIALLGDDAPAIEIRDQFAEGLQVEVAAEDGADDLGLGLVDDELFVLGIITKRDGAAGPFALAPATPRSCPAPARRTVPARTGQRTRAR